MLTIAFRAMVKESKSSMFALISTTFWLLKSQIYHFSPFFNTIFLFLSPYPCPKGNGWHSPLINSAKKWKDSKLQQIGAHLPKTFLIFTYSFFLSGLFLKRHSLSPSFTEFLCKIYLHHKKFSFIFYLLLNFFLFLQSSLISVRQIKEL